MLRYRTKASINLVCRDTRSYWKIGQEESRSLRTVASPRGSVTISRLVIDVRDEP